MPSPASLTGAQATIAKAVGYVGAPESFDWTRSTVKAPLDVKPVSTIVATILAELAARDIVLPEAESFTRRAVIALLSGHLVIQGPPGTGKTTVARIIADAFNAGLDTTTATADWSTYDVVGGLRPASDGSFEAAHGAVAATALACAELIRSAAPGAPQAQWLLIDELNRADIDKSIGSLYTVLSSVAVNHLEDSPLQLWFEIDGRRELWVPSRFRIIGTMNDVDTSFVNTLSQGLTRRFQFLTLGVSVDSASQVLEVEGALAQAQNWVASQYGSGGLGTVDPALTGSPEFATLRSKLQDVVEWLRDPDGAIKWPLGTAQLVDVWRVVLLGIAGTPAADFKEAHGTALLDQAVADLVVPQASALNGLKLDALADHFASAGASLPQSAAAVKHLRNTRETA